MTTTAPATHALLPHPATPCPAVTALTVEASAPPGAYGPLLQLRYVLHGELAALRWPAPGRPGAADELWRHTCFEAFIGQADDARPAYREFNFAPNGQWASYAFRAERERDTAAPPVRPVRIASQRQGDTLTLEVALPAAVWPAGGGECRLGLSAVIETQDGALAYFALAHPREAPDFHHRAGWPARLPAPPLAAARG